MSTPPNPLTPAVLLAVAARLGWLRIDRNPQGLELGAFVDDAGRRRDLVVSGTSPGTVEWQLTDTVPAGLAPILATRITFDVLHGGALLETGEILYKDAKYRVRLWFDGSQFTADAFAA